MNSARLLNHGRIFAIGIAVSLSLDVYSLETKCTRTS
jgi:hypothetical protein